MKNLFRVLLGAWFFICVPVYGQMIDYSYVMELEGITDQWHKIDLPEEIFTHVTQDLQDIRIYGITPAGDTVEAPYLLQTTKSESTINQVSFDQLNASYDEEKHYVTFEIPSAEAINRMDLRFAQSNFDWRVKLEGSQDQSAWFTILDDYRILSISNEITKFTFTELNFPVSKYLYYRIGINSTIPPQLDRVTISHIEKTKGAYQEYSAHSWQVSENKELKQTVIDLDLRTYHRLSEVSILIKNGFDYYRPVAISYVADSTRTEKGWLYSYRTLSQDILNSMEENTFTFESTTLSKLKIRIDNGDNQPLTPVDIQVRGFNYYLIARFTEPASYYLTYGNTSAQATRYDIGMFKDKIPDNLSTVQTGNQELIATSSTTSGEPFFKNSLWLWAVMIGIILMLGYFSLRMIRNA